MSRHVTSYMSAFTWVQLTYCNIKLQFNHRKEAALARKQNTEYLNKVQSGMYQTHLNCWHFYT